MIAVSLRFGGLSFKIASRVLLVNAALLTLVSVFLFAGLMRGAFPITPADFVAALNGRADPLIEMIVFENRFPRLLTALGVGLALGLAGEMVQTMLRNPLASPDIIGFSAGASFGAVLSVLLTGGIASVLIGSVLGGAAAASLVVLLSWQRGLSPGQLVLTGIGIMLTVTVLSELLLSRVEENNAAFLVKWLVGSFGHRSFAEVQTLWLGILLLLPFVFWHQFQLARAALHDQMAQGLGINLTRCHVKTVGLAVLLVGMSVAAAGPLPFVAFVAGPIAHGLNRQSRPTLLSAALVGALIAIIADALALSLPPGFSLPAGVFTALIGAPVLIWVLISQRKKRAS